MQIAHGKVLLVPMSHIQLGFQIPVLNVHGLMILPCLPDPQLGSAGSTSFEEAVYKIDPSCSIHTFDHTLDEELTKKVTCSPAFLSCPFDSSDRLGWAVEAALLNDR
jgi:hypothetical protein